MTLGALLIPLLASGEQEFTYVPENTAYEGSYVSADYIPRVTAKPNCSCVLFVRDMGLMVYGNARDMKPNISEPIEGGGVLFKGAIGHVAYILRVEVDSVIIVESNHSPCKITYRRISRNSASIKGFISPKK